MEFFRPLEVNRPPLGDPMPLLLAGEPDPKNWTPIQPPVPHSSTIQASHAEPHSPTISTFQAMKRIQPLYRRTIPYHLFSQYIFPAAPEGHSVYAQKNYPLHLHSRHWIRFIISGKHKWSTSEAQV